MQDIVQDGAQYSAADVLLFDAVPSHRGTTRAALSMMGFKQIIASSDIDEVFQSISQKPFDVLIADLNGTEERICKLVRGVRQGEIGSNPFMTVLLTSWGVREDQADMVMGSGADDVLIRPYSVSFLAERVNTLVQARKKFVVTADYVGPCRRKSSDRANDAGLLEVPNSLRVKAMPDEANADIVSAVREARSKVGELRLVSVALQMRLLAYFASNAIGRGGSIAKYVAPMAMFSRLLDDKLRGSSDSVLAAAAAANKEAIALAMQGQNLGEQLARSLAQATAVHERLCSSRTAGEIEQEFLHAVQRLEQREAKAFEAKTGT